VAGITGFRSFAVDRLLVLGVVAMRLQGVLDPNGSLR
jgi:hypothetical protein